MDFNEGMMPSTNGLADPNEDLLGTSHTNPFDSGFDAEHPFPTYEQLRNAGFSSEVAHNMIDGLDHAYSQKELYHVLYESDDPLTAYNEMMDGKVQETCDKIDELVDGVEKADCLVTQKQPNSQVLKHLIITNQVLLRYLMTKKKLVHVIVAQNVDTIQVALINTQTMVILTKTYA